MSRGWQTSFSLSHGQAGRQAGREGNGKNSWQAGRREGGQTGEADDGKMSKISIGRGQLRMGPAGNLVNTWERLHLLTRLNEATVEQRWEG